MLGRMPGQQKKIAEYVIQNKESFYRLAYSYVRNREDALDIVQDSIQKAIASGSLQEMKAIKSWFYKIIVHTSLDFLRRSKKVTVADDSTIQLHAKGTEDQYRDIDLMRALDDLTPEYRSVIVLRYLEDLKIEEVAEILDVNVNTVKTRLYKGLKMLRIQMDNDLEEANHHG